VIRREAIEHRRRYRRRIRRARGITNGGGAVLGLAADPTLLSIGAVGLMLALATFRSPLM
jgi:hypothetical protein